MAANPSATELVRVDARSSTLRAHTIAVYACVLGDAYLLTYSVLHALHVLGRDPLLVKQLSSIPLFATAEASLGAALLVGWPCAALLGTRPGMLRRFAHLLYFAIAIFALEIVLFP